MTVMTATASVGLPPGRPLTYEDLAGMPDDGHRYELIDGVLLVSPAPVTLHQQLSRALFRLLDAACPPGLEVFFAPLDVVPEKSTALIPDLLVTRTTDLAVRNLPGPPLLAVEIASPSTAMVDLTVKKAAYERMGCPAYWVIDPRVPSARVFELTDGEYAEVRVATGDETVQVAQPYPVVFTPASLLTG